ncbi:hypothetical protein BM221_001539 [Beauveria bassiana]|uniref:Uncharacterized protein n=1 Tax=Beauveria bassiana TaxID=176275 RepID=A0A2N6NW03_BEABA|nr:hypothetical protein BM221_001539 [Beauveria bassiana]
MQRSWVNLIAKLPDAKECFGEAVPMLLIQVIKVALWGRESVFPGHHQPGKLEKKSNNEVKHEQSLLRVKQL